ncbi:uncharacterized protein EDB91DRAFT_1338115 [Suillus paluster]|uniref:uncharacterized protein n=1 Tax=Suillus paluster TaxID=48578 RepID=UPI001B873768|nr:uncharacterized protein EDB91DRAFT_1338115 [Suillus paluster]KAG1733362.1 hypothetical protein EDB91DRAFT_1338115 [Suillus paluster]
MEGKRDEVLAHKRAAHDAKGSSAGGKTVTTKPAAATGKPGGLHYDTSGHAYLLDSESNQAIYIASAPEPADPPATSTEFTGLASDTITPVFICKLSATEEDEYTTLVAAADWLISERFGRGSTEFENLQLPIVPLDVIVVIIHIIIPFPVLLPQMLHYHQPSELLAWTVDHHGLSEDIKVLAILEILCGLRMTVIDLLLCSVSQKPAMINWRKGFFRSSALAQFLNVLESDEQGAIHLQNVLQPRTIELITREINVEMEDTKPIFHMSTKDITLEDNSLAPSDPYVCYADNTCCERE